MTTPSQSDQYLALSRRYIRQADEELAQEDYLQAGEKAWGAVATAIKAVSERRGWFHKHHDLTYEALMWLADEFGRQDLKDAFAWTERVHRNYYEDRMTEPEVIRGIERSRFLRQELENLLTAQPPAGQFTPESNRQKRRWEKLTGRPWDNSRPE